MKFNLNELQKHFDKPTTLIEHDGMLTNKVNFTSRRSC